MLNKNLFRSKLAAKGLTQKELGIKLGWSENTVSSKVNGGSKLCVDEVDSICRVLGITDATEKADIFLHAPSQIRDKRIEPDSA